LEASFIQTQPTNVRQTIEFVTERMTSLCTTHLQETVIASEMQALDIEVQDKVQCEAKNLNASLSFSETVTSLKVLVHYLSSSNPKLMDQFNCREIWSSGHQLLLTIIL